jgi:hypothetical protein
MSVGSILSSIFSQALFTINGGANAASLKISKVHLKYTSSPMRHMKEDGSTIVDARIIRPVTISAEGFAPDLDTQTQINNIMLDRFAFYKIESKGLVFDNMMVDGQQVKQTPQVLSAAPIQISFKQVLTQNIVPVITAQSGDASMLDHGMAVVNDVGNASVHFIIGVQLPGQPINLGPPL